MNEAEFYDERRIGIVPMGFCFPGLDSRGADTPPRPECRTLWHDRIFKSLPEPKLILCIGHYAVDFHFARLGLAALRAPRLTDTIANWRAIVQAANVPLYVLPHPSWRNNGWLRRNPWFEIDLLPVLRLKIRSIIENP